MKKGTLAVTAAVFSMFVAAATARAQAAPPFVYSVKYLCGLSTISSTQFPPPIEPTVKPGNYATSINIHNYHLKGFVIQKKAVVANGAIGKLAGQDIGPNQSLAVDCSRIVRAIPPGPAPLPPFIEGFVEIVSPLQLSVTSVYTSQTCGSVANKCNPLGSLSIEVVPQTAFRDQ
jgi:hypothetical protein